MTASRTIALTSLAAGLSACASAPTPDLYTLSPVSAGTTTLTDGPLIGLSEITLPAYARNQQITTAISNVQVEENDDHRWAVPPSEAVTTRLGTALEGASGGQVVQRPWPRGLAPDLRLQVSFDRLLRSRTGGAELAGQFIIVRADNSAHVERFAISVPSTGNGYGAYMEAMSEGLGQLGGQISNDLSVETSF